MADGASPTIPPKDAIVLGMKYFKELMERQPTTRVLLEGLFLNEKTGDWVVTFGFDSEQEKPLRTSPMMGAPLRWKSFANFAPSTYPRQTDNL
jgi:hypothetical protein